LQYSKTPKSDPFAAFLGAALGAFIVYMSLSTFGTGGADLTDLAICCWYGTLGLVLGRLAYLTTALNIHSG
jgi:hypothetical protein